MNTVETKAGIVTIFNEIEAAKVAAISMNNYMAMMSESSETTRGMVPGVSAGAAVVGAICGVAGLGQKGTGDEENNLIEVEINNISSYPMVPTNIETNKCDVKIAPRPIMTGDKTSIKVKADGAEGGFATGDSFALSIFSGLFTELSFTRLSESSEEMMWQITNFYIDGTQVPIPQDQGKCQSAIVVAYQSDREDYSDILYYFHPVKRKGTASLCFANYYPTA